MSRYESAYRDYTSPNIRQGHSSVPARPARRPRGGPGSPHNRGAGGRGYGYTTDEESRAPSDRSASEYTVTNPAMVATRYRRSPSLDSASISNEDDYAEQQRRNTKSFTTRYAESHHSSTGSAPPSGAQEIYVTRPSYGRTPASVLSQESYRTYRSAPYSETGTTRTRKSQKGGIVIETMRAPHPLCPNTRSCCCLMILFNLGLLLLCLGFAIVLQLNDPPFVWYLGIVMLIFGFGTIIVGLVFCACMCQEDPPEKTLPPHGELYWTHHWRKNMSLPEIHREKVRDVKLHPANSNTTYHEEVESNGRYSGSPSSDRNHRIQRY